MPAAACRACDLKLRRPDVWAQIAAGRGKAEPTPYRVIAEWLSASKKERVSHSSLRDHFLFHEKKGPR